MQVMKPLYDRIIVERIEVNEEKVGSLYVAELWKEKPQVGLVLACGTGARNEHGAIMPLSVRVGDVVVFGRHNGYEIRLRAAGTTYLVLGEDEVFAILREVPDGAELKVDDGVPIEGIFATDEPQPGGEAPEVEVPELPDEVIERAAEVFADLAEEPAATEVLDGEPTIG